MTLERAIELLKEARLAYCAAIAENRSKHEREALKKRWDALLGIVARKKRMQDAIEEGW
jgi:hypothetical protein